MEAFLCPACLCIYTRTTIRTSTPTLRARPCPYHRCTAARHETHHGHVLRHAMEHGASPGNDPSTSLALLLRPLHGTPVSSLPPALSVARSLFFVSLSCTAPLFSRQYSSFLPRYRVQGQPIEGNFLVPIASVRSSERTIRFASLSLSFYPNASLLFFRVLFSPFLSLSLSFHGSAL